MLTLKACPRCGGDLVLERERRCGYLACVQCGHVVSVAQERGLGVRVSAQGMAHLPPHAPKWGAHDEAAPDGRVTCARHG